MSREQVAGNGIRRCDRNCIANVDGECAVAECRGPIRAMYSPLDAEAAARLYGFAQGLFEEEQPDAENAGTIPQPDA